MPLSHCQNNNISRKKKKHQRKKGGEIVQKKKVERWSHWKWQIKDYFQNFSPPTKAMRILQKKIVKTTFSEF